MTSEAWNVVSYDEAEGDEPSKDFHKLVAVYSHQSTVALSPEFTSSALVDALHDSACRSTHAARSFLGTHVAAKQRLSHWLATVTSSTRNPRDSKEQEVFHILWLHGDAGTGKTTLMQTLADALLPPLTTLVSADPHSSPPIYASEEFGSIGINFGGGAIFFSRENKHTDATKIFTTIAFGLASCLPPLAAFIQSAFDANNDLITQKPRCIREQAELLIFNPIKTWVAGEEGEVDVDFIMIVDGLDECDDKEMQAEIVRVVKDVFKERIEGVRWYWIFSSRAEMRLRGAFFGEHVVMSPETEEIIVHLASDAEMDAFLDCGFAKIREMHDIGSSPADTGTSGSPEVPASSADAPEEWPSSNDKEIIKWQAGGLYAASASILDYIAKPDDDPRARIVLIDSFIGNKDPGADHPLAKLDILYKNTLATVASASVTLAKRILGAISCLQPSSHKDQRPKVSSVAELLDIPAEKIHEALYDLHSVVSAPHWVPSETFDWPCLPYGDGKLSFCHPTFDQFLRTPSRSLDWGLNLESVHMDLARCCLKRLAMGDTRSKYPLERWYLECWRTGKDTEAALGILPDLYEFDFTVLPEHAIVDRYFVEWLLHLQDSTMSEYQLLKIGPPIELRTTLSPPSDEAAESSQQASSSSSRPLQDISKEISYPPRQSYILGFEPSKQVSLVPFYDVKTQTRADIGSVIGPGLKHWDLIRGFKVVSRDGEMGRKLTADEDGSASTAANVQDVLTEAGF
ncbi:hypothetical protein NP233_g4473 [Leucocoprinus birnbaumii]|uniref:Nephrocystin 3-like N-terminal domain-containing protein n=1 Tax=Leucocoprinus birnbaumii TaxID=56174 RepID=A0AAD5VXB2_9AGAR|nr:hypothetical protein NP233_g4473 [Leucocoprinus birnbaumii]